jgi:hypothetical protein
MSDETEQVRGVTLDVSAFDWPIPPDDASPVDMLALVDLRARSAGRVVNPGDHFDAAPERAFNFVLAGMAAVSPPPPAWWPQGTPSIPSTILGPINRHGIAAEAS